MWPSLSVIESIWVWLQGGGVRYLLFCFLVWALPLCAAEILVVGDSLTKGYGLLEEQAYPALLEKKMAAAGILGSVRNGGVSGDTSAGALRRVRWLLKKKADVVILAVGGNDGLRGIDPDSTEKNIREMIKVVRELNPEVKILIVGMIVPENMGKDFATKFEAVFAAVAKSEKVALMPNLLTNVAGVAVMNQADRIHPNEAGQAKIAENVWKELETLLKK
jgi:acyl-CoA thioesterase-1